MVKEFIFVESFMYLVCFNFKENLMYHLFKFINDISSTNLICFFFRITCIEKIYFFIIYLYNMLFLFS